VYCSERTIFVTAGVSRHTLQQLEWWRQRIIQVGTSPDPQVPPPKRFRAKLSLPTIVDYKKPAGDQFWERFPNNHIMPGKSLVSPYKLEALARCYGVYDWVLLDTVCRDLSTGANIGCTGAFREASCSSNAPSAFQYPAEITEAIATWVQKGFAAGPFEPKDRPVGVKVNGIMCRPKPNGSARVILNLSAPSGASVNDGIDSKQFPATMSSTARWIAILHKAGRRCLMLKMDWADAYKHIHVREEDLKLQWFSWLGKDFVELCLIFGAASSAGIYDRLAKIVADISARRARFPADMLCQYLDDLCAAASCGSQALFKLEEAYTTVAREIGVKLAPTTEPDKAFSPCTHGTVLGVEYDTVAWTWCIPAEKLARLILQIRSVLEAEHVKQDVLTSLTGRILHYAPLVPTGRFNINYIVKAGASTADQKATIHATPDLKRQLFFWLTMLRATTGFASIPDPPSVPPWALDWYTDAAGGSTNTVGLGTGGVGRGFWFFAPWSRKINCGVRAEDGKKLSRKMSALELVGPLICLAAGAELCRGKPLRIWVDNSGSVEIWRKGYSSSCGLCTTLVKAIATVAAAFGCKLAIMKVTRCSNVGACLADALSKADFARFRLGADTSWELSVEPARVPATILAWIANPAVDDNLGDRLLVELRRSTIVPGYNC
jgi:hypothetical protein